jgi:hypothetical protein
VEPNRKIRALLTAAIFFAAIGVRARESPAEPLVIQGGITAILGALVTVKTPNGYPGGSGPHALFVSAGPAFKVDVSHARVLLANGTQADKVPLAVGDRVVMVLSEPNSGPPATITPRELNLTYSALIVERIVAGDKLITH